MRNIVVFLATMMMFTLPTLAKDGKIKISNQITYQGGISNKQADGEGCIYFKNPQNKKEDFAQISGYFSSDFQLQDAKILSHILPSLQTEGKGVFTFSNIEPKGAKFQLELTEPKILSSEDTLQAYFVSIDASLIDNQWQANVRSIPFPWMKQYWRNTSFLQNIERKGNEGMIITQYASIKTPQLLQRTGWKVSHIIMCSNFKDGYTASQDSIYYVLNPLGEYVYNPDGNEFVNVSSTLSFKLSNGLNSWSGYRVLRKRNGNILIVHRKNSYNKDVEIEEYTEESFTKVCNLATQGKLWSKVKSLSSYSGTIDNCDKLSASNFSSSDFKFITGKYVERDAIGLVRQTTNWFNGEEENQIRKRLVSSGITASDLQLAVMNGKISTDKALQEQKKRNEWLDCRAKGILPTFKTLSEIEAFLNAQPDQFGKPINDWNSVKKLYEVDPALASYRSQDPLDLEIYRQSSQYLSDTHKFNEYKNNFYMFRVPLDNINVDGNSFTVKVNRGWYRGLCKTKRENYLYLEYRSGNSIDGTYTFVVPIKRQNLKPKYYDFAPEEITYPSTDLHLLKNIRDTNLTSKLELYLVFKPGCLEDPKAHKSWRLYYMNPVGLYLVNSINGKIILDMSSVLGKYSEDAVKAILKEQKKYDESR